MSKTRFSLLPCLVLALPAMASQARSDTGYAPTEGVSAANTAGLRAIYDPATGKLVDTPQTFEQAEQLNRPAMPRPDYSRFKYTEVPGLGVMLDTQGQTQMNVMVRRGPDGEFQEYCLPGALPQGEQK